MCAASRDELAAVQHDGLEGHLAGLVKETLRENFGLQSLMLHDRQELQYRVELLDRAASGCRHRPPKYLHKPQRQLLEGPPHLVDVRWAAINVGGCAGDCLLHGWVAEGADAGGGLDGAPGRQLIDDFLPLLAQLPGLAALLPLPNFKPGGARLLGLLDHPKSCTQAARSGREGGVGGGGRGGEAAAQERRGAGRQGGAAARARRGGAGSGPCQRSWRRRTRAGRRATDPGGCWAQGSSGEGEVAGQAGRRRPAQPPSPTHRPSAWHRNRGRGCPSPWRRTRRLQRRVGQAGAGGGGCGGWHQECMVERGVEAPGSRRASTSAAPARTPPPTHSAGAHAPTRARTPTQPPHPPPAAQAWRAGGQAGRQHSRGRARGQAYYGGHQPNSPPASLPAATLWALASLKIPFCLS